MKRVIKVLAFLIVLAALGGGGYYFYTGRLPGYPPPPPAPEAPAQAETPAPAELPAPVLSGEPVPGAGQPVATLSGMERTVKSKRASDLAWEEAQAQMPLYENDAIRTFDKASATIAFGRQDIVEVDQNALVVIKPRPKEGQGGEISLALLSGDFLDSLAAKPAPEQTRAIEEASSRRQVTISKVSSAGQQAGPTRVALKTLPDRSTTIAAIAGTLKVVGPKGESVTLKEKMVTRVTDQGVMIKPRQLPGVPSLAFPDDGA